MAHATIVGGVVFSLVDGERNTRTVFIGRCS